MYIIRLMGGLGNQMFQYAAAYIAAKNNDQELKILNIVLMHCHYLMIWKNI